MQTSGLKLDFYDDEGGVQLREIYPTADALPGHTKTASVLDRQAREQLPDDVFALVLHAGDTTLRKFACFDGGNTALSVGYFLHNAHKLPEEAQKLAASNLLTACGWYAIEPPEDLRKIASGQAIKLAGITGAIARHAAANPVSTAMTAITAPSLVKGVTQEVVRNEQALHAAQQMTGSSVVTPEQLHHMKHAEVTGTSDMPVSRDSNKPYERPMAVVKKTGEALATNEQVKDKAPDKAPKFNPHIDVTGKTASALQVPQYCTRFALEGKYPLDSYEQVKQAEAYFQNHCVRFSPEQRHDYCANLVKRASELGLDLSCDIRKYGSQQYAPPEEIEMALSMRRNVLQDDTAIELLDKVAAAREELPPLAFAEVLAEFDKVAGLDRLWDEWIFDPFYSTFGTTEKTAAEQASEFVDAVGNAHITGDQLKAVAKTKREALRSIFGADFCDEFCKEPISIYSSLPREQKLMVINLANDNAPGVRGSHE